MGIDDNTLIFFTSDNGREGKTPIARHLGQTYGLAGRKRSLKESGIRVPGLISGGPSTVSYILKYKP